MGLFDRLCRACMPLSFEIARRCTCVDIGQEPTIVIIEISLGLFWDLVKVVIWRVLLIVIDINSIWLVAVVRWPIDRLKRFLRIALKSGNRLLVL